MHRKDDELYSNEWVNWLLLIREVNKRGAHNTQPMNIYNAENDFCRCKYSFQLLSCRFVVQNRFLLASKWSATTRSKRTVHVPLNMFIIWVWLALCILRFVSDEQFLNIYTKSQNCVGNSYTAVKTNSDIRSITMPQWVYRAHRHTPAERATEHCTAQRNGRHRCRPTAKVHSPYNLYGVVRRSLLYAL